MEFAKRRHGVVTLVCHPQQFTLDETEINSVVDMLQASGAIIDDVEILAPDEAVDIYFAVLPLEEARYLLHVLLEPVAVDFCVQSPLGRRKQLLLSDMDSTIIGQECIDELADYVGQKAFVSEITERAMRGEIAFSAALKERVALLKGLETDKVEAAYRERITLNGGAKALIATMQAHQAFCVLVSGGFTVFTEKVARDVGFDVHEANSLNTENGRLTGTVQEPILNKTAKVHALLYYMEQQEVQTEQTLCVGDGANDVPMLEAAGLGVAYHAKPAVQEAIIQSGGACVNHADLTALLYFQGYREGEIVA